MPNMNGFEVSKYLKSNSKTSSIPVIFLTAVFKSEEFVQNGFELGAIDYLTKPIDKTIFFSKVKNYLVYFIQNKTTELKKEELEQTNKKMQAQHLKELEITKEKMLNVFTHELKTPLNGIIGFSAHIKRGLNRNPQKLDRYIKLSDEIHSLGHLLLDSVESLLSLSKVYNNQLVFCNRPVQVDAMMNDIISIYDRIYNKEVTSNIESFKTSIPMHLNMVGDRHMFLLYKKMIFLSIQLRMLEMELVKR
jgi:signal transduction histidine kinase